MATFDAKRLGARDWALVGAGAVMLVASLLPWYTFTLRLGNLASVSTSRTAWSYGLALLGVMASVAASAIWLAHKGFHHDVPSPGLMALVLSGLSVLFILLRWLTETNASSGVASVGPGYGLFVALAVAVVQSMLALSAFQAGGSPGSTAGRGSAGPDRPPYAG